MAAASLTDSTIIEQVLAGQPAAFQVLVTRYYNTVRLVALAKTGNVSDAEDVAQDTFLKAYETLGALRDPNKLAPWLVTIARNRAISLVRRRERERRNLPDAAEPREAPDPAQREFFEAVARQVDALPGNFREVVLLHYFEGLKCRQIAERLDLSTNAVVKRLSRGRELLGDRLLREWGHGAHRPSARPRIQEVMGAIAILPAPDWEAQRAGMAVPDAATTSTRWGLARMLHAGTAWVPMGAAIISVFIVGFYSFNAYLDRKSTSGIPAEAQGEASTPPYQPAHLQPPDTPNIRLQADENIRIGLTRVPIEPPAPRKEVGFISGTAYDHHGAPLREVRVTAVADRTSGHQLTNPNGEFRINLTAPTPDIDTGDVRKYVNVFGHKVGYAQAMVPDIALGTTGVRLVLTPPAIWSGTVIDATTGVPLSNFSMWIEEPDTNPETGDPVNRGRQEFNAVTGAFSLYSDYGIDIVRIVAPGYVGTVVEPALAPGESESGQVIALDPGGTLRGYVYDKVTRAPIPDASVHIDHRGVPPLHTYGSMTDRNGAFTLSSLPPSTRLDLIANAADYAPTVLTSVEVNSATPVTFYLDCGGVVRGRVLYAGGPPPGARDEDYKTGYCVVWIDGSLEGGSVRRSGYVRADGTYEVHGLAEGTYFASAFFWPPNENRQSEQQSLSRIVHVRDGQTTHLDLDYDVMGGTIEATVGGADPETVFVVLASSALPDTILQQFHLQNFDTPRFLNYGTLEPGNYLLRARRQEDGALLGEEAIQVRGGQVTEVHLDLADLDTAGESEVAEMTGASGARGDRPGP